MDREKPNSAAAENRPGIKKSRRLVARIFAATAAALFLLYFAAKAFLATEYAAESLSGHLSEFLGQRVVVAGMGLSGITLSIRGVTVADPEGFPEGSIISVRSLLVVPDVPAIIAGSRSFNLLKVEGLAVNLRRNDAGTWNFQPLVRNLTGPGKKEAAEIFVNRLVFRDVSLKVNDYAVEKLALSVNDFSTKGSSKSKLEFAGSDEKGNPFRLAAEGRLGKDPDLRLDFDAPDLSLGVFREMMKGQPALDLAKGMAHITLAVRYHSGKAVAEGRATFDHLGYVVKEHTIPLRGELTFTGNYEAAKNRARLEHLSLALNEVLKLSASGTVHDVKGAGKFDASLSCAEISLKDLAALLPEDVRKDTALDGSLSCGGLSLAGNMAQGVTAGGGKFSLRKVSFEKSGMTYFRGLSADVVLSRATGGWTTDGKLILDSRTGKVPLEKLEARFTGAFSEKFRPVSLEIPLMRARLMGAPVNGRLSYVPKNKDPYRVSLSAEKAPLAAFGQLLGRKNITFSAGTARVSVQGTGKGTASFSGELNASLTGSAGMVSGKKWAVNAGTISGRFKRSGNRYDAAGKVKAEGGEIAGNKVSASFAYAVSDGTFSLTGGKGVFRKTTVGFARLGGKLPVREGGRGGGYPLDITFAGLDLEDAENRLRDASGRVTASYNPAAKAGALQGSAALKLPSVSLRGRQVGAVKVDVSFAGTEAVANMDGTAFDGTLSAVLRFNPHSPGKGVTFKGRLHEVRVDKLTGLLAERTPVKADSGRMTANLDGEWSTNGGMRCAIDSTAHDLTVTTLKRKILIRGARLEFKGGVAEGNLRVERAVISHGGKVALKMSGHLAAAAAKSRTGKFSFELAQTPVNSLFDAIVNLLPRTLQEADAGGNIDGRAVLAVNGARMSLEGDLRLADAMLEIPSQKLVFADMNGTLPISLFLAGLKAEKPADDLVFSRENYGKLVNIVRQGAKGGSTLKIGKIRFGALETANAKIRMKAEKGRTEILFFESDLYGGTATGSGYFLYSRGPYFSTDLLIKDLSLRQFCSSYPALEGYISGLLDGVVSLYGEKGGIPTMIGFIDLWTHRGKAEKMLVSKEFLQKLAGKNLKGFFFRDDRPYDRGEISAYLLEGYLTFDMLTLSHNNFLGMKDLNVSVAPAQNMIGVEHLLQTIREAAARGKPATGTPAPPATDFNWLE